MEREREECALVRDGVKCFLRFFACGPRSPEGWLLWGLMCPVTVPIFFVCQLVIGCLEILVGELTGSVVVVDGGGDGMFDEVSCRRREEIKFLLGQGDYDH